MLPVSIKAPAVRCSRWAVPDQLFLVSLEAGQTFSFCAACRSAGGLRAFAFAVVDCSGLSTSEELLIDRSRMARFVCGRDAGP